MRIAVEGCCHGELDKIYETLAYLEDQNKVKVDLLLICGDFQSVRNRGDLQAMAVPPKYRKMNTFYKYYSGEKKAPVLTVFIGGNHEASNYLQELPYGGWVAPNIFYMGYANVLNFGGIRIAGLSGIFKGRDYNKGHFEHPPYTDDTLRTCYHVRNVDVFRLKQLQTPIDIILSHDWPRGIYNHGNVKGLLQRKSFFREEVESGTLGSPPAEEVLHKLKPDYWFAAHLHVKFAAMVDHKMDTGETKTTKFLSLDKCLPRRKFLQVLEFPTDPEKSLELELDPEWLAILKSTNHLLNLTRSQSFMPGIGCSERWDFAPTEAEVKSVTEDFGDFFKVPDNFEKTVPEYDPKGGKHQNKGALQMVLNPQTTLLCDMLGITDPFAVFCGKQKHSNVDVSNVSSSGNDSAYMEDSSLANDSDFIDSTVELSALANSTFETTANPDEISLDGDASSDEEEESEPKGDALKARLSFNSSLDSVNRSQDKLNTSTESTSSGSPSTKRAAEVEPAAIETNPSSDKPKKFKRRNQSLYEAE